jgi:hypothetical protein
MVIDDRLMHPHQKYLPYKGTEKSAFEKAVCAINLLTAASDAEGSHLSLIAIRSPLAEL